MLEKIILFKKKITINGQRLAWNTIYKLNSLYIHCKYIVINTMWPVPQLMNPLHSLCIMCMSLNWKKKKKESSIDIHRGQLENTKLLSLKLYVQVYCIFFTAPSLISILHVCSLSNGTTLGWLWVKGSCCSLWWGLMAHSVCLTMGRLASCSRQSGWRSATGTTHSLILLRGSSAPTHLWTLKAPSVPRTKPRKLFSMSYAERTACCSHIAQQITDIMRQITYLHNIYYPHIFCWISK